MTSEKHTPGPWEAESFDWKHKLQNMPNGAEVAFVHVFSGSCEVARCGVFVGHGPQSQKDNGLPFRKEQTEANARLIAAAPELLEELQSLLRIAGGIETCHHAKVKTSAKAWSELYHKCNSARAAIAKATGE